MNTKQCPNCYKDCDVFGIDFSCRHCSYFDCANYEFITVEYLDENFVLNNFKNERRTFTEDFILTDITCIYKDLRLPRFIITELQFPRIDIKNNIQRINLIKKYKNMLLFK